MATVNDELFDKLVRHQIGLTRLSSSNYARLVATLNKYDPEIRKVLDRLGGQTTKAAVNRALRDLREINGRAYARVEREMTRMMKDLAISEAKYQEKAFRQATPREALRQMKVTKPTQAALNRRVVDEPINGALIKEHIAGMQLGRYNRMRDAIRREVAAGGTETAVIQGIRQSIIGSAAASYKDGLLGLSRRSLEQHTRTVSNGIANMARSDFFEKNDDIFDGVMWVAMLETNTCAECQALDGTVFPVDEGPRPAIHPNCRCEVTPVVKDWEAMGLNDLGPGTRESMNGEVPETLTYNDWLKTQSAEVQNEVLGPTRAEAFRGGGITLDRFVDETGRKWTLDELEKQGVL